MTRSRRRDLGLPMSPLRPNKRSAGSVALSPTGLMNANPSLQKYNYLDPTVALREVPHPSAQWAGKSLQPVKSRQ